MQIDIKIFFNEKERGFLGKGRVELLKSIDHYGSIAKAAKALGMCYKAAWDRINAMNALAQERLIESKTGGKGGGGSALTPYAKELIQRYEKAEKLLKRVTKKIARLQSLADLEDLDRTLQMRISARNKIAVKIVKIRCKTQQCTIYGSFEGKKIKAIITKEALEELGLQEGEMVHFIFKASALTSKEENCLKGTIIKQYDEKRAKVMVGEHVFHINGKFRQKGYHATFCIKAKDIIVAK